MHGVVVSGPLVFITINRYNFFQGSCPDTISHPGCSYNHGGKGSATRDYFLPLLYHSSILPNLDVLHATLL